MGPITENTAVTLGVLFVVVSSALGVAMYLQTFVTKHEFQKFAELMDGNFLRLNEKMDDWIVRIVEYKRK